MKNKLKIWIIIASLLCAVGCLIAVAAMALSGFNFPSFITSTLVTNVTEIGEDFSDIIISSDTADIKFVLSEDGKCKVECHEEAKVKHNVTVEDGALKIKLVDNRLWYETVSIGSFDSSSVTVYLPQKAYNSLVINTSTSDVEIPEDFSFENLDVKVSTGDVKCKASAKELQITAGTGAVKIENVSANNASISTSTGQITAEKLNCSGDISLRVTTGKTSLTDVTCKNLTSVGGTGDIMLTGVVALGQCDITRDTGDVTFVKSDAASVTVKTDTGDVTGTFLTDKIIYANSSTGDIDVPKCTSGGMCDITTSTGDIIISIVES